MSSEQAQGAFAIAEAGSTPDSAARRRAAKELDATMFVEAGAGTGKTGVLVSRVVELVLSRSCAPREIAAITFTEAAAAELRERIRAALFERLGYGEHGDLINEALEGLDEAAMTTIHGFAQRLLAEFPLEAGLPLRFEVLDAIAADLDFARRFSAFLDVLFDEADSRAVLGAAVLLGMTTNQIRALARSLAENTEHARATMRELDVLASDRLPNSVDASARALREQVEALCRFASTCEEPDDRLLARLLELRDGLDLLDESSDWLDRLSWIASLRPARVGNVGRKQAWAAIEEVRDGFARFEALRGGAIEDLGALVVSALARRLAEEGLSWAGDRRAKGVLHFDDLLCLARDLIVTDRRARRLIRQRYRRVLVDEFQDTDPLQLEILRLLGAEQDDGTIAKGRLFFVGDPRQSIYRFRGAGLASYQKAKRLLAESEALQLVTNFRSVPGIIAFVNDLFAELMTGEDVLASPEYLPLVAAREEGPVRHPVLILGGPLSVESATERRQLESDDIAAAIARARQEGWPIEDREGWRPAEYGDIAILLPRRTGLSELESALDARSIPYRVASASLIYASQEVRDLLALLKAIESPAEETAIVAALRTPAFGCSDEELYAYRVAGGEWRLDQQRYEHDVPGGEAQNGAARVAAALFALQAYHRRRQLLGPSAILEEMLSGQKIRQLLAATTRGREALRRVQFLCERVRAFELSGGRSIAELLEWLELEASGGASGVETQTEDDDNAVRILTIHGAKGLEFPIVVLGELGGARALAREARVLIDEDGRVEIRAKSGLETSGFSDLYQGEAVLDLAESIRLCYVGATRARDHLVLALHHQPAASEATRSMAELIYAVCTAKSKHWQKLDRLPDSPILSGESPKSEEKLLPGPGEDLLVYARVLEERKTLLERVNAPASSAASRLEDELSPWPGSEPSLTSLRGWENGELDEALWGRRRAASSIGRAVHAVLQRVDLSTTENLDALALAGAIEEHCPEDEQRIAQLTRAALSAPVLQAARSARQCYRELPVSALVAGGMLECVIDLCYLEDGHFVIVDYKTDALDQKAPLEQYAARYRMQAGAYALALERAAQVPVARVVLVFAAAKPGPLEYEIPDLSGAVATARAELESRFLGLRT